MTRQQGSPASPFVTLAVLVGAFACAPSQPESGSSADAGEPEAEAVPEAVPEAPPPRPPDDVSCGKLKWRDGGIVECPCAKEDTWVRVEGDGDAQTFRGGFSFRGRGGFSSSDSKVPTLFHDVCTDHQLSACESNDDRTRSCIGSAHYYSEKGLYLDRDGAMWSLSKMAVSGVVYPATPGIGGDFWAVEVPLSGTFTAVATRDGMTRNLFGAFHVCATLTGGHTCR